MRTILPSSNQKSSSRLVGGGPSSPFVAFESVLGRLLRLVGSAIGGPRLGFLDPRTHRYLHAAGTKLTSIQVSTDAYTDTNRAGSQFMCVVNQVFKGTSFCNAEVRDIVANCCQCQLQARWRRIMSQTRAEKSRRFASHASVCVPARFLPPSATEIVLPQRASLVPATFVRMIRFILHQCKTRDRLTSPTQ